MEDLPRGQERQAQAVPGVPAASEPPVRRWPHPVNGADPVRSPASAGETEATLHYIRCALSYQNQLLADIKTLLERLIVDQAEPPAKK